MADDWLPITCQCEHAFHLDDKGNGGCERDTAFKVKTTYGTYYVCVSCKQQGHMAPYSQIEEL
jgi:hypothetical protein